MGKTEQTHENIFGQHEFGTFSPTLLTIYRQRFGQNRTNPQEHFSSSMNLVHSHPEKFNFSGVSLVFVHTEKSLTRITLDQWPNLALGQKFSDVRSPQTTLRLVCDWSRKRPKFHNEQICQIQLVQRSLQLTRSWFARSWRALSARNIGSVGCSSHLDQL